MKAKRILKKVARRNGVSLREVRKEIQEAINYAWRGMPGGDGKKEDIRKKVPCRGDVPTPEELISYISNEARRGSMGGSMASGWQAMPEESV